MINIKKMKILIVYPRMTFYGGAELLVVRLANFLSDQGIENAILTACIHPDIRAELSGTRLLTAPASDPSNPPAANWHPGRVLFFLHSKIKKHLDEYDLINVHNYPAEMAVFMTRKPVVWMCNEPLAVGMESRLKKKGATFVRKFFYSTALAVERAIVRNSINAAIVADRFNHDRFLRLYGMVPDIIPYGIDCDFFGKRPPGPEKQKHEHFSVLQVGMLTPMKNQMASIEAIGRLKENIPDIHLILAGTGEKDYVRKLRKAIASLCLDSRVTITGHLNRAQIRKLYHTCNVLLHPIQAQGGWLSPFEAMCAGLPIIVSSEMTAAQIIESNSLGIVTDQYADAVMDVYKNPQKYRQMAQNSAVWVQQNLSWNNFCGRMAIVFEQTIQAYNR